MHLSRSLKSLHNINRVSHLSIKRGSSVSLVCTNATRLFSKNKVEEYGPGPVSVVSTFSNVPILIKQKWNVDELIKIIEKNYFKLPKGFGRLDDQKDSKEEGKEEKNKRGDEKDEKDEDEKKKKKGPNDGQEPEEGPDPQNLFKIGLVVSLVYLLIVINSSIIPGVEISWTDFVNKMLVTGLVDHLEYQGDNVVRVVFKSEGNPSMLRLGARFLGYGGGARGSPKESYSEVLGSIQGTELESHINSIQNAIKHHSSYYFIVGSVDAFLRQLEDVQVEMGLPPRDFVSTRFRSPKDNDSYRLEQISGALGLLVSLGIAAMVFSSLRRVSTKGINLGDAMRPPGMSKDPVKPVPPEQLTVRFKDVAGVDSAKNEIQELVDFLKAPKKFFKMGAKIPRGALLVGPPGTGKTLLAKATAGEAGVPFFTMSGSEFVEMYVGVGASRVRKLFAAARAAAPSIVFIDEIDSVAKSRGAGRQGGNDEREATLNQLLVELDGFSSSDSVIVMAGTNRVDTLDKALLRPGRFDRHIAVNEPTLEGRRDIFLLYLQKLRLHRPPSVYAERLAGLTPGFTGAQIANMCNEAAIDAVRTNRLDVAMQNFEVALDRILTGQIEKSSVLEEDLATVAYHEAGHAVASWFSKEADPLLRITITPRSSGALGFAQYLPSEKRLQTRSSLRSKIVCLLAGRVSEEINFEGTITNGAADDLDKATNIAKAMVLQFGMGSGSSAGGVGPQRIDPDQLYSDRQLQARDDDVRAVLDNCYKEARAILTEHAKEVKLLAESLLKNQTITHMDVEKLIGPRPYPLDPSIRPYVVEMFEEPPGEPEVPMKDSEEDSVDNEGDNDVNGDDKGDNVGNGGSDGDEDDRIAKVPVSVAKQAPINNSVSNEKLR